MCSTSSLFLFNFQRNAKEGRILAWGVNFSSYFVKMFSMILTFIKKLWEYQQISPKFPNKSIAEHLWARFRRPSLWAYSKWRKTNLILELGSNPDSGITTLFAYPSHFPRDMLRSWWTFPTKAEKRLFLNLFLSLLNRIFSLVLLNTCLSSFEKWARLTVEDEVCFPPVSLI